MLEFSRRRLRTALAVVLTAALAMAAAQDPTPQWRSWYLAEFEGGRVTIDLHAFDDGSAFARLSLTGLGTYLSGHGEFSTAGALRLSFHLPRPVDDPEWEAVSVLRDARLLAAGDAAPPDEGYEVVPFGPVVATLEGSAAVAWNADFDPITARLTFAGDAPAAGQAADEERPGHREARGLAALPGFGELTLAFERRAQQAVTTFRQGRIEVSATFPYFVGGAFQRVNSFIEADQQGKIADFVTFARESYATGGGWGMVLDESVSVTGSAAAYLSLRGVTYAFTGGAHGNTFVDSYLLEVAGDQLIRWQVAELFAPASDWAAALAPLVLEDLAAQGAMWVTDGSVVALTERDLRVATLSPAGLTFHFDPYEMGPYVQGPFRVTLPYSALLDLAVEAGPLTAFALEFGAR